MRYLKITLKGKANIAPYSQRTVDHYEKLNTVRGKEKLELYKIEEVAEPEVEKRYAGKELPKGVSESSEALDLKAKLAEAEAEIAKEKANAAEVIAKLTAELAEQNALKQNADATAALKEAIANSTKTKK
jgi:hypothetical protein